MDDFLFHLQELIARNKIQQVIKILLSTFQKCESKNPAAKDEMRDLRNQVVLLSARFTETSDKINSGVINPIHADTAKNQLISSFLNVIGKLPDYKEFSNYINDLEEEKAWEEAQKANSIDSYRIFFSKYPQGKYKEETQRIISELETIEKAKEAEFKRKAKEEKARRVKEEEKARKETEYKAEKEQAEKQKEEFERKDRERQKELDDLKKQLAEKEREDKEELDKVQKTKAELARKEHEHRQTLATQEEKAKESLIPVKQQSVPLASATIGEGENIRVPTTSATKFSIFSSQNILWTLLPFTSVPFAIWLIKYLGQEWGPILLIFLPLVYGVLSFALPLKPIKYSLISIGLASFMACLAIGLFDNEGIYANELAIILIFFGTFAILSLTTIPTLYFRNKYLDKNKKRDYITRINFFSKQSLWWTLLAFPISPIIILTILENLGLNDSPLNVIRDIGLIILAYSFVSFVFPLKPQKYSLVSIGIASLMIAFAHLWFSLMTHGRGYDYPLTLFLINISLAFTSLALVSNIILYFRNKALDKKQLKR